MQTQQRVKKWGERKTNDSFGVHILHACNFIIILNGLEAKETEIETRGERERESGHKVYIILASCTVHLHIYTQRHGKMLRQNLKHTTKNIIYGIEIYQLIDTQLQQHIWFACHGIACNMIVGPHYSNQKQKKMNSHHNEYIVECVKV